MEVVEGKEESDDQQNDKRKDGDTHGHRIAPVKILNQYGQHHI